MGRREGRLGLTTALARVAFLVNAAYTEAGRAGRFTATTDVGNEISADIWFQAFGVRITSDYLTDSKLTPLTARATVPVTDRLTVQPWICAASSARRSTAAPIGWSATTTCRSRSLPDRHP